MEGLKRFVVVVKRKLKGLKKVVFTVVYFVFRVCAVALLYSIFVYFLWNALMPEIFGLTTINFWQALGLTLLSGCLFRSSGTSS